MRGPASYLKGKNGHFPRGFEEEDSIEAYSASKTSQSAWRMTVAIISMSEGQLGSKMSKACSHKKVEVSSLSGRIRSAGLVSHDRHPLKNSVGMIAKVSPCSVNGTSSYMNLSRAYEATNISHFFFFIQNDIPFLPLQVALIPAYLPLKFELMHRI